jgi:hypothetical protein
MPWGADKCTDVDDVVTLPLGSTRTVETCWEAWSVLMMKKGTSRTSVRNLSKHDRTSGTNRNAIHPQSLRVGLDIFASNDSSCFQSQTAETGL